MPNLLPPNTALHLTPPVISLCGVGRLCGQVPPVSAAVRPRGVGVRVHMRQMEDKVEVWPPSPTSQQGEITLAQPKKALNRVALGTGFSIGLLYWAGVWCAAYSYARSVGSFWQTQLPFGLAAPDSSPEFVTELSVGSLLLLLLLVLLRRPMRDFGKGLATSYLPFGLLFLFVLLMYFTTPGRP